jgi:SnoaL-like domain
MTEASVRDFVKKWFKLLDVHAGEVELLPLLAESGLVMQFPNEILHGVQDFRRWYETATHTFFDEEHKLSSVHVSLRGECAEVELVVNWQAKSWRPPQAKSDWLGFDAHQLWTVVANANDDPVIAKYIVDKLDPMSGSAFLDSSVALWPKDARSS